MNVFQQTYWLCCLYKIHPLVVDAYSRGDLACPVCHKYSHPMSGDEYTYYLQMQQLTLKRNVSETIAYIPFVPFNEVRKSQKQSGKINLKKIAFWNSLEKDLRDLNNIQTEEEFNTYLSLNQL